MPEVHFIGDISFGASSFDALSLTWAIVPGSNAWTLKNGLNYGETHVALTDSTSGKAIFSHPIDTHFQASACEGWPLLICELWDRSNPEIKHYIGCGSIWLPSVAGNHNLQIFIWRHKTSFLANLRDSFLPNQPDLITVRELTMSPFSRHPYKVSHLLLIHLISTIVYNLLSLE